MKEVNIIQETVTQFNGVKIVTLYEITINDQ